MTSVPDAKGDFHRLGSILHTRDTALTGFLIHVLEKQGVDVPMEVETLLYSAADEFQTTEAALHFLEKAGKSLVQVPSVL